MVNYIYKGYGVTDSNGIAKLAYDANGDPLTNSYTGVGAGEVDFIASTDAPSDISDSSFQSEPYPVLDCIRYDDGTGTLGDYWTNTSLLTRNADGTTTLTASNYAKSNFKVSGSPTIAFTDGMTVEFDLIEVEGSPNINGNDGSDRLISLNTTGHYKIVFKDNLMSVSVNGGTPTTTAFNTSVSTFNVGFRSPSGSCSLKFDNFLMY